MVPIGEYRIGIAARANDKYTMYIYSSSKRQSEALRDFPGTEMPAYRTDKAPEERTKLAIRSMVTLDELFDSIGK